MCLLFLLAFYAETCEILYIFALLRIRIFVLYLVICFFGIAVFLQLLVVVA
jgi:hypothetical protein